MNVIKRSGEEVVFDASKIENAIKKANKATTHNQMSDELIRSVTQSVIDKCENLKRSPNVEEIQDMVEGELMEHRCLRWLTTILRIVMNAHWFVRQIQPINKSCLYLSVIMKK